MSAADFLREVLLDSLAALDDRCAAARLMALVPLPERDALRATLDTICQSEVEPVRLYMAAGQARARLDIASHRDFTTDDLTVADFVGTAGLAYDEEVAAYLRSIRD